MTASVGTLPPDVDIPALEADHKALRSPRTARGDKERHRASMLRTATRALIGLTSRGVYPLMLNVNGYLDDGSGSPFAARVGELHLLTTVVSLPASVTPDPGTTQPTAHAIPVSTIWSLNRSPIGRTVSPASGF